MCACVLQVHCYPECLEEVRPRSSKSAAAERRTRSRQWELFRCSTVYTGAMTQPFGVGGIWLWRARGSQFSEILYSHPHGRPQDFFSRGGQLVSRGLKGWGGVKFLERGLRAPPHQRGVWGVQFLYNLIFDLYETATISAPDLLCIC